MALSLTMFYNLHSLVNTIQVLRAHDPALSIYAGGQAYWWGGRDVVEAEGAVVVLDIESLIQRL